MNFQTKLKKDFEGKGYKVVKLIKLSENGYPDLMLLKDGKAYFVEVKEPNDTLKELQKFRIDELNKIGCIACCMQKGKGVIWGKDIP